MLGERVMVAPVVTPGAKTRTVQLPGGRWRYAAGITVRGPRVYTVNLADLMVDAASASLGDEHSDRPVLEPLLYFTRDE
eukprot:scaffold201491_cov37-Prasinocladus_malaysianus.AAC.2